MIIGILIYAKWEKFLFWWLNFTYNFPILGKIDRLAKDYESTISKNNMVWLSSEATLCSDYFTYYNRADKDEELYQKSEDYLAKADETGRTSLHILGWILIASLVFVEAMGFSYVLSGYTIPGASENLQQKGAIGIAFIISVLLVGLTHWTGHELHSNSLILKAKTWWKQDRQRDQNIAPLRPNTSITLDKTFNDNNAPQWQQLVNRLKVNNEVNPSYTLTIITFLAILIIAVLATYVRGQVLEKQQIEEKALIEHSQLEFNDPYSTEFIPSDLIQEQNDTDKKALNEALDRDTKGGWGTFIFLAFLFIFLQIFGILIGYKNGFAGKKSKVAYDEIGNFNSEKEFKNYYINKKNLISRIAQKQLLKLQQKMSTIVDRKDTGSSTYNILKESANRNFLEYVYLEKNDEHFRHQQFTKYSENTTFNESNSQYEHNSSNITPSETQEEMELRIRKELEAEILNSKKHEEVPETEDEMRSRLRKELLGEN